MLFYFLDGDDIINLSSYRLRRGGIFFGIGLIVKLKFNSLQTIYVPIYTFVLLVGIGYFVILRSTNIFIYIHIQFIE